MFQDVPGVLAVLTQKIIYKNFIFARHSPKQKKHPPRLPASPFPCYTSVMKINPEVYILFSTYEDYKSMPGSLTPEEMAGLHKQILDDAKLDADSADLFKNVFAAAVKYSQSRAGWPLWDREKRMGEDSARTSRHNQVIDSLNILARYLKAQGKAAMWRDVLGEDRKRIGDFACYLVFVGSLNAR